MAKKRVHEIAKERGITSKEALEILQKAGLGVTAPASSVEEADAAKAFGNGATAATKAPAKPKKAAAKDDGAKAEARRRRREGGGEERREAEAEGRAALLHPPPRRRPRLTRSPRAAAQARASRRGRPSLARRSRGRGQAGRSRGSRPTHSSGGSPAGAAQAPGRPAWRPASERWTRRRWPADRLVPAARAVAAAVRGPGRPAAVAAARVAAMAAAAREAGAGAS